MVVLVGLQRVHLLKLGSQSQVIRPENTWLHVLMVEFIHLLMVVQIGFKQMRLLNLGNQSQVILPDNI